MNHQKLAIWVLGSLLVSVLLGVAIGLYHGKLDVTDFVASASTFAIAILTVAYVQITSGQLKIMNKQLVEMSRSRELSAQPYPAVRIERIYLEKPRFFYTPPRNEYSANPRMVIEYKVVNHGNVPAVSTVPAAIMLFGEGADKYEVEGGAEHISILGPSEVYPNDTNTDFLFTGKKHNKLLSFLVDRKYKNPPHFTVRTVFRNVLGGCFANTWVYEFAPKDEEDFRVLSNWRSRLASFEIDYAEELEQLKQLQDKDDEKWHSLFGVVRKKFGDSLEGDDELELGYVELPNTFSAEIITFDRFNKEIENRNFGRPIPKWMSTCLSDKEDG